MDAVAAGAACLAVAGALPAVDAVRDVSSAAAVSRRTPLQCHRRVVQGGDGVLGCRRRP